jgi:hypothetical protein
MFERQFPKLGPAQLLRQRCNNLSSGKASANFTIRVRLVTSKPRPNSFTNCCDKRGKNPFPIAAKPAITFLQIDF